MRKWRIFKRLNDLEADVKKLDGLKWCIYQGHQYIFEEQSMWDTPPGKNARGSFRCKNCDHRVYREISDEELKALKQLKLL